MLEPQTYTNRETYVTTNKMLKNTYMLLSMTLIFSAVCALISIAMGMSPNMSLICSVAGLVVLFVTLKKAEGASGLMWVFIFTGLEGLSLGPILQYYTDLSPMLVPQAFGLTAVIFLSLSFYAITTKKDFSFMRAFLFVGLIMLVVISLLSFIFPVLGGIWLSYVTVLLFTGLILFDTSRIVNGGETNYIRATIALYLDFLNMFLAILRILGNNRN